MMRSPGSAGWRARVAVSCGAFAIGWLSGCTQPSAGASPAERTAHPEAISDLEPAETVNREVTRDSWVEALTLQRWAVAAERFDRAHPEPAEPHLRYIRARIASELADARRAATLLDGLETSLTGFSEEIVRMRAMAHAEVGPYEKAADYFADRADARSQLRAAHAYSRAGKPKPAMRAIERGLKQTAKSSKSTHRTLEAELRRLRAELSEQLGHSQQAIADYRFLTFERPTLDSARTADTEYERLAERKLTKKERFARAEAFTEAGDFDGVQRELERMDAAPGPPPPGVEVLRTRAWSYYKSRRDYAKAASLFEQASQLDARYRTQDLFFAARALSRAHRDEEAIVRYLALAKRYPNSSYAEQSRYLAARLYYLLGRFKEALLVFNDYQKRYPRGRYLKDLYYDRAVTHLALGQGAPAFEDLERVVRTTESDRERAFLNELKGLALLQAGKPEPAARVFRQVIDERPLSFAALLSIARLRAMGAEVPPAIEPSSTDAAAMAPLRPKLPKKVRLLIEWGLHLDAEDELYRLQDSVRQRHEPRGGEALCEAYGALSTAERRYSFAHRVVRERVLMHGLEPRTRWMWECIYPTPYSEWVRLEEQKHDLPSGLIHAVMRQESAFKPTVLSHVGAVGLMQLMPATANHVCQELDLDPDELDLKSPPDNIQLGAFYLGKLLETFQGSIPLAAAGYNAGPTAVRRWLSGGSDLPLDLWVARIPYSETRGYVKRVVGNWARYRYLHDGPNGVPQLTLGLPDPKEAVSEEY